MATAGMSSRVSASSAQSESLTKRRGHGGRDRRARLFSRNEAVCVADAACFERGLGARNLSQSASRIHLIGLTISSCTISIGPDAGVGRGCSSHPYRCIVSNTLTDILVVFNTDAHEATPG